MTNIFIIRIFESKRSPTKRNMRQNSCKFIRALIMWKKYVILLENFVISLYVMHIILQLKITKANVRQSESSMKSTDCHEFLSFLYIRTCYFISFCMFLYVIYVIDVISCYKKIQIYFFYISRR